MASRVLSAFNIISSVITSMIYYKAFRELTMFSLRVFIPLFGF